MIISRRFLEGGRTLVFAGLAVVVIAGLAHAPAATAQATAVTSPTAPAGSDQALSAVLGIFTPPSGDAGGRKADELYNAGLAAEQSGNLQEAIRDYDQSLKLRYDDPRVHIAMGRIMENTNPALSLFHYQCAFRYTIDAAADKAPAVDIMRRFLVGRYLQYALPINADNPEVSTKLLELASALAPEDPRIHAHMGTAYFHQKSYERSIQESRNALALGLDEGLIYTNLAAAYAQLHKKIETESMLVTALERDEMDINEALNAIRSSNQSDTLVTFDKLLGADRVKELMDNSTKGRLEAALLAWKDNKPDQAMKLAQEAADRNPAHSYAMIVVGDFKRHMGDTAGAIAAYKAALQRNAANQLANARLGDITFASGDFVSAADNYMKAMDVMQGRVEKVDILDRTAVALARNGKHDQALTLLDKWLKANPDAPEAFELNIRRAGILTDANRRPEAEAVLKGLVDRDKLNPAAYIALYTYYDQRQEKQKATRLINDGIILIQSARDKDAANPTYYRDLARMYRVINKENEARKELLNGGLRTNEKRFFSNALFAADAETDAYQVLKSWIDLEPKNPEAVLSHGWVAAKLNRDLEQAMANVEMLAKDFAGQDIAPIRRTRAYLNYAMKNYQKAIDDIKAVLAGPDADKLPQAAFFHRLWGLSAEALGNKSEAAMHFQKAMDLDPDANADLSARMAGAESSSSASPPPAAATASTATPSGGAAAPVRTSAHRSGNR